MESERTLNDPRQACSVESAALMNSDAEIYFVFATNSSGVKMKNSQLISKLFQYSNIKLVFLNPIEFSKGSAVENFFKENKMENSSYPIEHMADLLRILILNKFGGQYLDLDLFSLVPLSEINQENFAVAEDNYTIANGIINLNIDEKGGKLISNKYLELVSQFYDPNEWGFIGPELISQVVNYFCPFDYLDITKVTKCGNFSIFPPETAYPVSYVEWRYIFVKRYKNYILRKIRKSKSKFFHVWNAMRKFDEDVRIQKGSAYMHLAKKYCPKVYEDLKKGLKVEKEMNKNKN